MWVAETASLLLRMPKHSSTLNDQSTTFCSLQGEATVFPRFSLTRRRAMHQSMAEARLLRELHGKYRILAQLGEGGTAHVWLAVAHGPSGFNKLVVLKTIRSELLEESSVVEMFLDEARLAARLNHPNVVQTNEVFEQGRHPVIVMEYLDGVPFSAVLERQRTGSPMALAMLLKVVSESLAGLHSAHELGDYDGTNLGLVHRDVSPHNLFITFAGQVKVLDFGVAQLTTSQEVTQTGEIKGKLRYMAPEQIAGERVDRRADIYSVGVILWEIAASKRMWPPGTPEAQIMKMILGGELPALRETNPQVEEALLDIITRALSADADTRFETALDLQQELDEYISSLGGVIRNRDVGRTLSKMFADVRDERASTIEEQMKNPSPPKMDGPSSNLPELTSFTHTPGDTPKHERRQNSPWVLFVAIFFSISAFLAALLWPSNEQARAPEKSQAVAPVPAVSTPPATSSVPDPNTPPARPTQVSIHLTAFPRTARMTLDGTLLPTNPYSADLPEDDLDHELVITARGYKTQSKTIRLEKNVDFALTLLPKQQKAKATETTPTAAPATNCSPPYFFDERGIKKYKPECM